MWLLASNKFYTFFYTSFCVDLDHSFSLRLFGGTQTMLDHMKTLYMFNLGHVSGVSGQKLETLTVPQVRILFQKYQRKSVFQKYTDFLLTGFLEKLISFITFHKDNNPFQANSHCNSFMTEVSVIWKPVH